LIGGVVFDENICSEFFFFSLCLNIRVDLKEWKQITLKKIDYKTKRNEKIINDVIDVIKYFFNWYMYKII